MKLHTWHIPSFEGFFFHTWSFLYKICPSLSSDHFTCEVSYMKFTHLFYQFSCVKLPIWNLTLFVIKFHRYICMKMSRLVHRTFLCNNYTIMSLETGPQHRKIGHCHVYSSKSEPNDASLRLLQNMPPFQVPSWSRCLHTHPFGQIWHEHHLCVLLLGQIKLLRPENIQLVLIIEQMLSFQRFLCFPQVLLELSNRNCQLQSIIFLHTPKN